MATGAMPRHDGLVSPEAAAACQTSNPHVRFGRSDGSHRRAETIWNFRAPFRTFGFQLYLVQIGLFPRLAKPLKGLGSGVVELAANFDGDAFRAVYTVRFGDIVYVLHSFKKRRNRV